MGRKIFVSYKYSDGNVKSLRPNENATVRNYVDLLQDKLEKKDHVNKGEDDGEDLSEFKDDTIESKLREKIWDSSVTIVLISQGMKSFIQLENDQWIPWEIAYSLRESKKKERTSKTNAVLSVVLPDRLGRYDYFLIDNHCSGCNSRLLKTHTLFQILSDNMFNEKKPDQMVCITHQGTISRGECSYILAEKWTDFMEDPDRYIDRACAIRDNIGNYNIVKTVS